MNYDMTKGSPSKLILRFSVPFILGNLFQQLYSTVDMLIVGQCLNANALAAVGASGLICSFLINAAGGAMTGFSAVIAQRFGAKKQQDVKIAFFVSLILMAAISFVLIPLGLFYAKPLLTLLQTPGEILEDANSYLLVTFAGTTATLCYNLLAGAIRAVGNSKLPFYALIIGALVNIVLDYWFIKGLHTGVWGAALATVISQVVSCIVCVIFIWKRFPMLHITRGTRRFCTKTAKKCLSIGMPMFFQYSLITGGAMMGQSAINMYGTSAITAMTSVNKVLNILMGTFCSVGSAMVTYVNQNMGAKDLLRVHAGVKAAVKITIAMGVAAALFSLVCGKYFVYLFVGNDPKYDEILGFAMQYIYILSPAYMVVSPIDPLRSTLHGLGLSRISVLACGCELLTRGGMALLAHLIPDFTVVCFMNPAAWVVALIVPVAFYIPWYVKNVKPLKQQ